MANAYQDIKAVADRLGITRFEVADMSPELKKFAFNYAYGYEGTFDFMVDMRNKARFGDNLSDAQCKGICNCAMAEAKYQNNFKQNERYVSFDTPSKPEPSPFDPPVSNDPIPAAEGNGPFDNPSKSNGYVNEFEERLDKVFDTMNPRTGPDNQSPVEQVIPNGTYTIAFTYGHTTIRVRDDFRDTAKDGWQMVEFLSGPDNTNHFKGFAFLQGDSLIIWSRYKQESKLGRYVEAIKILLEDPEYVQESAFEYALRSGRCARCGRKLTVPASIHRGYGPICAGLMQQEGWFTNESAHVKA